MASANNHPAVGVFFTSFLSLFVLLLMGGFIVLYYFNKTVWMGNKLPTTYVYPDEILNWFLFGAITVGCCWLASLIIVYKNLRSCCTYMKSERV
ncbi:hypothetical protein FDP41_013491 [Naegleria fowleri]|uniref:Uncharacterized protein n=1 Tax=Naegleria fowleri TaxID=5763 RepID=A0A6A5BSW9_NAEFO|nr:uncharacterized protein FDP41_013491 [Naegleria fowleri]KAF0980277.1 hypothetical protein FDP41_013491 [Naegleria fowleri]CAG4716811.1 unnamed protein product [Naegleria fowleri]